MWSASPTLAPALVMMRSWACAACASAVFVAAKSSGKMPPSLTAQPQRRKMAESIARLLLKMWPAGSDAGAMLPGSTNSSPVENRATRTRRCTCSVRSPRLAASPRLAGLSRVPRDRATLPAAMSWPARRIHWPAVGALASMRTSGGEAGAASWTASNFDSNLGSNLGSKGGLVCSGFWAEFEELGDFGVSCATIVHCSCMMTASAPAGMGAPVKMRAAVPAASGAPIWPAAMRWLTGSVQGPAPVKSARRTA